MCSVQCTSLTAQWTVHRAQHNSTVRTVRRSLCMVHSAPRIVHRAACTMNRARCNARHAVCDVMCSMLCAARRAY
eukprot:3970967-Lingulodinium_polyedra.AAC.1